MSENLLLTDVNWNFGLKDFENIQDFKEIFEDYNESVKGEIFSKNWNEIIIEESEVIVQYMYYSDKGEVIEPQFLITSSSSGGLSLEDILYNIHKEIYAIIKNKDQSYLECLKYFHNESIEYPGKPFYLLLLGS